MAISFCTPQLTSAAWTTKTLDTYANQIAFYSFPSVRPLRPKAGKRDRVSLMEKFQPDNLLPKGTEANLEILANAVSEEASSTGFFNVYPDVDGVVGGSTSAFRR